MTLRGCAMIAVLAALAVSAACGKKGPPVPPPAWTEAAAGMPSINTPAGIGALTVKVEF